MISLITTFDPQRLSLLPWFVNHYRACGVDAFYIELHFDSGYGAEEQADIQDRANALFDELGLRLHSAFSCPYDIRVNRQRHDQIQSRIAADSPWIVWADSDEFNEFPDDLSKLTAYMSEKTIDYIGGCVVDRMARRGLPVLRGDVSPWRQFPLGTDITQSVLKAWVQKIVLTRAEARLGPGNHRVRSTAAPTRLSGIYPVHHFKWDAAVVPRLERRLEDEWRQRCPWWHESRNALDWISAGHGETFAGLSVYDFEDDLRAGDGGPLSDNPRYARNQQKAKDTSGGPVVESPG